MPKPKISDISPMNIAPKGGFGIEEFAARLPKQRLNIAEPILGAAEIVGDLAIRTLALPAMFAEEKALEAGAPPAVAFGLGIVVDLAIPGPGEFKRAASLLKKSAKELGEETIMRQGFDQAQQMKDLAGRLEKGDVKSIDQTDIRLLESQGIEVKTGAPKGLAEEARKFKTAEEFSSATGVKFPKGTKQFYEPITDAIKLLDEFPNTNIKVFGSTAQLKRATLSERQARNLFGTTKLKPDLDVVIVDPKISKHIKANENVIDFSGKVPTKQFIKNFGDVIDDAFKYDDLAGDVFFKVGNRFYEPTEVGFRWVEGLDGVFNNAKPIKQIITDFFNQVKGGAKVGALVGAGAVAAGAAGVGAALKGEETPPEPREPRLQGVATGTNYDPFDPAQTKPDPDGIGAAGVEMKEGMVAVPRIEGTKRPVVPFGTVLFFPDLDRSFLVADLLGPRFTATSNSTHFKVDFAVPNTGKQTIPEFNRQFNFEIEELGTGRADARRKAAQIQ